jgi:hypothetical protein
LTEPRQPRLARPAGARAAVATGVVAAGSLLLHGLWFGSLRDFFAAIDPTGVLFADFLNHYEPTGRSLFSSGLPAPGYFYSASFALVLALLMRMPAVLATWLWGSLEVAGSLLLLFVPARHFFSKSPARGWAYLALCGVSVPLFHGFKWGQVSVFVMLAILGAALADDGGRTAAPAWSLAAAAAVNVYPALLGMSFLARRRYRLGARFAAASLVLFVVLPVLCLGPHRAARFQLAAWRQASEAGSTWVRGNENSQYAGHVAGRLLSAQVPRRELTATIVGWMVFLFGAGLLRWRDRKGSGVGALSAWSLLLLSLPFVLPTSWPHYFVFLPFCVVAVWDELSSAPLLRRVAGETLCLLASLLASTPALVFAGSWRAYARWGTLFFADALLLLAAHLSLWGRRGPRGISAQAEGAHPAREVLGRDGQGSG